MKKETRRRSITALGVTLAITSVSLATAAATDHWDPRPVTEEVPVARGDIQQMHKRATRIALRSQAELEATRTSQIAAKRGKRGPRGPQGPQGPQGATGPQGVAGAPGSMSLYTVVSPLLYLPASDYGDYTATCTSGGKAISGGFIQADTVNVWANTSTQTADQTQWIYSLTNASSSYGADLYFVTVCAR